MKKKETLEERVKRIYKQILVEGKMKLTVLKDDRSGAVNHTWIGLSQPGDITDAEILFSKYLKSEYDLNDDDCYFADTREINDTKFVISWNER